MFVIFCFLFVKNRSFHLFSPIKVWIIIVEWDVVSSGGIVEHIVLKKWAVAFVLAVFLLGLIGIIAKCGLLLLFLLLLCHCPWWMID